MNSEIFVLDQKTKNEVAANLANETVDLVVIENNLRGDAAKFAVEILSHDARNNISILRRMEDLESRKFVTSMVAKVPSGLDVLVMLKWKQEYALGHIRFSFPEIYEHLQSFPETMRGELARGVLENLIMPAVKAEMSRGLFSLVSFLSSLAVFTDLPANEQEE